MGPRTGLLAIVASLLILAGPAQTTQAGDAALDAAGWRQFTPPGSRPADITLGHNGAVTARAGGADSFLYWPIAEIESSTLRLTLAQERKQRTRSQGRISGPISGHETGTADNMLQRRQVT